MAHTDTRTAPPRARLPLALLLLAGLPLLWISLVAAPRLRVDVGAWGDHSLLAGINGVERSSTEDYRWTAERAELALPDLSGRYRVLRMRAHGWRPEARPAPLVRLDVGGRPWSGIQTAPEMRRYRLLLPHDRAGPTLRLGFASQTYSAPDSPRVIGFALDWVELLPLDAGGAPSPWHLGSQALLLALGLGLLWAMALPGGWTAALGALLVWSLAWANLQQPLWVSQAIGPWLALLAGLLLATRLLAPRLQRLLAPWLSPAQARAAWALLAAALALRLAGAAHPLFSAHDVDVHTRWLNTVGGGQLYFYSTPSENQGRPTFNPPAGYVLLLPLWLLLPSQRLVAQVGVALGDWLGCLLVLLLARELRLAPRAGLLALALYLALPISMTMLWWGFATNALSQPLWLLLLWAALRLAQRPTRAWTLACAVLCAVALMTHIGALLLMLAALALLLALGWRGLRPAGRAALLGRLGLALLFTAPVYFAAAAGPLLAQSGGGALRSPSLSLSLADYLSKGDWVLRGVRRGFLDLPAALAPVGLIALLADPRRSPLGRAAALAWLGSSLLFLGVNLSMGLLVRYLYFAAPLVCLALGAMLAPLWRRPAGRAVALALALLVVWSGTALWIGGVLLRAKPSLVPLTH